MELTTCARPYARAAFEHARGAGQLSQWSKMLSLCAGVVRFDNVVSLLSNPSLTGKKQAQTFLELCQGSLSNDVENFIHVLSENKRLELLPVIDTLFNELKAEEERSQDVSVTTAFPLSSEQRDTLAKKIEVRLGRSVTLNIQIDKSLIGGVIIKAGDLVIDGSLRARLTKLADAMVS